MQTVPSIVTRYYELLEIGEAEHVAMLYTADAEIVRYDGCASTPEQVVQYFRQHLAAYPGLQLKSIEQVRLADDVLMWDAMLDSELGLLQTVDVAILDNDGLIRRHIPGLRGFWGG